MTTPTTAFYNASGGNLAIDAPSYIERRADTDLYQALQQHEYCYILTRLRTRLQKSS